MESHKVEWNKNIPYHDLPLIINSNLSNETLEWINNTYDFLIHDVPVFNLFYIINGGVTYKSYDCTTKTSYNFKEDLEEILFKYNIIRDKKLCVIIELSKKSNYHTIRYVYIDTENLYLDGLKGFIRKEKIQMLLHPEMKNNPYSIKSNKILTEEISSSIYNEI